MKTAEIFIKFGDYETYIYRKENGLVLKERTLIAFTNKGKKYITLEIGNKAKSLQGKTDNNTFVESPIQNGVIVNVELAKLLLSKFLKDSLYDNPKKIKATFLINCSLTVEEKHLYEELAIDIGIYDYSFIPNVVACLVGTDTNCKNGIGKMIVDFGSDCTQIAVINDYNIINGYSIELGGNIIDNAIASAVFENYNVVISDIKAEEIKTMIGSLHKNDIANVTFNGYDASTHTVKTNTIYAREFYQIFEVFYDKISEAIEIVLNQISADLLSDIANNGIYVCGGNSKMAGIENYLNNRLNISINTFEEPELICVKGIEKLIDDNDAMQKIVSLN